MTVAMSTAEMAFAQCAEGAALSDAGNHAAAVGCYQRAVALAPSPLELHQILANAQLLAGRTLDARATLRNALRVASRPDVASDFALGKALVDAGAGADAVPCFRRVRHAVPRDATVAAALAAALRDAQRPDEAWAEVQAALQLSPSDPVAMLTAAMICHDLSDFAGALQWCDASLNVRHDAAGARVTRSYLRFLLGDESGGWSDFESRPLPLPGTSAKDWRGEPLSGRSILVMGEQGVGDQFQFLRFVRHPALRAASRVVVTCQPEAVSLLRAAGYDAVARDTTIGTDFCVPLLSLPQRLDVRADWRPEHTPYLALAQPGVRNRSRKARVGVVWAGNPAHRNDAARSIPFALIGDLLARHPALEFVSMQHGVPSGDLPIAISEYSKSADWLATARELYTLDVLISVDTGIAHLAGALGMPVWLLVPYVPDWRWGANGSQTPWYVTMRLFRQPCRGDWSRVLSNVGDALRVELEKP